MKSFKLFFHYRGILFFVISPIFAQSGFTLSWDSEVGCLEYSGKRTEPVEDISDNDCLLTCQGSIVNFILEFGDESVSSLNWTVDGGQILNTNMGSAEGVAEIEWNDVQEHGNVTVQIELADGTIRTQSVCVTTKPKPQGGFEIAGAQSSSFCSESELFFENNAFVPDGSQIVSSQWDFGSNNMTYMPYTPGNTTISIDYTISIQDGGKNDIICHDVYWFENPTMQKPANSEYGYAEMKVVPNPVNTTAVVYYTLQDIENLGGDAYMELYGLQGNLISTKKIDQLQSEQSFDLSHQASGTYVIVVYHQGHRIGQQILIKK